MIFKTPLLPKLSEKKTFTTMEEIPKTEHGECCDECKKTCKRNFWTEVLKTIVKVGTAVLAAFGLSSCIGSEE